MNDHANKSYLKKGVAMRLLLEKIPFIKRFNSHRRAQFRFWPSFWMAMNKL